MHSAQWQQFSTDAADEISINPSYLSSLHTAFSGTAAAAATTTTTTTATLTDQFDFFNEIQRRRKQEKREQHKLNKKKQKKKKRAKNSSKILTARERIKLAYARSVPAETETTEPPPPTHSSLSPSSTSSTIELEELTNLRILVIKLRTEAKLKDQQIGALTSRVAALESTKALHTKTPSRGACSSTTTRTLFEKNENQRPTTNRMKNASFSLLTAKAKLKKRVKSGAGGLTLTPRELSKLRRKKAGKGGAGNSAFSGLLQSKMLQRRRALNVDKSGSPMNINAPIGDFGTPN